MPVFEEDPNDIKIVHNALKTIDYQRKNNITEELVIDVQDCGAAYRFLMAVLATTKGKWLLTGTNRLLQRPILPLVQFFNAKGASIEKVEAGWRIEGKDFEINSFEIDTTETSQFASAVMMVKKEKGERKKAEKQKSGKAAENSYGLAVLRSYGLLNPYIKMTQILLDEFDNCLKMAMLADWSAAVFWLANAMLTPNAHYFLKDLHFDELQGDETIASWFEKWGVCFTEKENGIEVKRCHSIEIPEQKINVAQTPDLAMILAVLSVCYPFTLEMTGVKNLNLKESNRLDIMIKELLKFTKIEKHSEDAITIYKRTEELPKTFHFDSYNDHRFVMAWSLFKNYGNVNIINSECVKKSYPTFNHLII